MSQNSFSQIKLQRGILAVVKLYTADNPVLSAHLEERFKAAGPQVRDAIRQLRRQGHPIANSENGYHYARTFTEIEPTLNDLESRAKSMLHTVSLMKENFFPKQKEQTNLFNQ